MELRHLSAVTTIPGTGPLGLSRGRFLQPGPDGAFAEIAGMIECHQNTLNQLIVELDNVDTTLRLFAPDIDLEEIEPKPVPPRNQAFKREMKRIILDALKRAGGEALNSRDIANLVMQQRGLDTNSLRLRVAMSKRMCAALTSMRRRGLLVSEKEGKGLQKWRLKV